MICKGCGIVIESHFGNFKSYKNILKQNTFKLKLEFGKLMVCKCS